MPARLGGGGAGQGRRPSGATRRRPTVDRGRGGMRTAPPRSQEPAPEQRRTLGFLLRDLYESLQRSVYAAVAADGFPDLREMHSPVLRQLPAAGARVADLARRCGLAKQSVAYIVDDLARLGYVHVEADESDGRAKRVVLTARGGRLIASLLHHGQEAESALAARIGAAQVRALRRALERAAQPGEEAGRGR